MSSRSGSSGRGGPRRTRAHAKALTQNPFLALAGALRRDVEQVLGRAFDDQLELGRRSGREVTELIEASRDLCLRGGKRLRAALVVTGYLAAKPGAPLEPAIRAGAALELLQSYLLIHDDWMDGDLTRRGGPAVHAALGRRFRSQRLGDAAGILAGDFTSAMAQLALAEVPLPPARASALLACYARMQLHAIAGQQLDLVAQRADPEIVYALKTGSYSVSGPLELGALLGGGSKTLVARLDAIAVPLGVAFQLRDDLLNAFGDPGVTGKPLGSDLTAGKHTLLLALAQKRLRGGARDTLDAVLGNPRASSRAVTRALACIAECGARDAVEARIEALHAQGLAELARARIGSEARDLLEGAAAALSARRA